MLVKVSYGRLTPRLVGQLKRAQSTWIVSHSEQLRETRWSQRALLGIGAAAVATFDPRRADMVNALNEVTGVSAAENLHRKMTADPMGKQILAEKPRLNSEILRLSDLEKLEENTLGKKYFNWLKKNGVTPDSREIVRYVVDAETAYVIQRYREIHDFYHVFLEQDIDLLGESVVKAFEAAQTGFPMCYLGIIGGVPSIPRAQRRDYFMRYLPWALHAGKRAKLLLNFKFEDMLKEDFTKLRREMNIVSFGEWSMNR